MSGQMTEAERIIIARKELIGMLIDALAFANGVALPFEAAIISSLITNILNDTTADLAAIIKANS